MGKLPAAINHLVDRLRVHAKPAVVYHLAKSIEVRHVRIFRLNKVVTDNRHSPQMLETRSDAIDSSISAAPVNFSNTYQY
jgi:hypothetical protein